MRLSKSEAWMRAIMIHYNEKKYWKYREVIVNPKKGTKLGKIIKLLYIKKCDAYNNASMGTHLNFGAKFDDIPNLPHGLNGIIVSHNAVIGSKCWIFHQVTIGEGRGGAPVIGDNVVLGAGCKIIGGVKIGSNAKIGAGCVVMKDIPDNAVVLSSEPTIIIKTPGVEK